MTVRKYLSGNPDTKLLELLLAYNLDPSLNNDILLIECAKNNNLELVKLLLEYGSDINSRRGIIIEIAVEIKSYELVDFLLDYVYEHDSCLKNAYDHAVQNDYISIKNLFLTKLHI